MLVARCSRASEVLPWKLDAWSLTSGLTNAIWPDCELDVRAADCCRGLSASY